MCVFACEVGIHTFLYGCNFLEAGLLPREIGEVVYCERTIHLYESVANCLPIHWQQNQEKGYVSNSACIWMHDTYVGGKYLESWVWLALQIVFVEKNKVKSTLLEEMEESQVPEIFGGSLPLVPIQDS